MKLTQTLNFVKFAACMVLVVGLSTSALASCGDSLSAMAAGAASVHSQSRPMQQNSQSAGDNSGKSMVGLWHIQFTVGGQTIQEAYQLWNAGGTEVHNPNVDPRGGSVCLGVWKHASHGAYKLAHRVWSYDTSGNFMGTIHLSETLTLGEGGQTQQRFLRLGFLRPFRHLPIRGSRQRHRRTHFGRVIRGVLRVSGEPQQPRGFPCGVPPLLHPISRSP